MLNAYEYARTTLSAYPASTANKTVHAEPWASRIFDFTSSLHGPVTAVVMPQRRLDT